MTKQPQVIMDKFEKGIAPSPYEGFADMRGINISAKPGSILSNLKLQRLMNRPVNSTFTADASTDLITFIGGTFRWNEDGTPGSATGRTATVSSSGTLPAPLAAATNYYVIDGGSNQVIKLATTLANALAGTAIDITTAGSGTHTITSVDMGYIKHFAKDYSSGNGYVLDNNGRLWGTRGGGINTSLWYLISGTSTTSNNGNGLAIWQGYIFLFRDNGIDYASVSAPTSWTTGWQTMNASAGTSLLHTAIAGQDDILYFIDADTTTGIPYVGSIQHIGTFDPTNSATFNFNKQALTLPGYKTITCIEEFGKNLMIGTVGREIYPWDRSSPSFTLPILAAEENIRAMKVKGNLLYFSSGSRGSIYVTTGAQTVLIRTMPVYITGAPYNPAIVGAMTTHKGKIFFTLQCKNANGVYSIDTDNGNLLTLENQFSSGSYGVNGAYISPVIVSIDQETYLSTYFDSLDSPTSSFDATFGVHTNFYYISNYGAYIDSPLYQIGGSLQPVAFKNAEIKLGKPLTSGQGIRLSYRKDLNSAFTVIGTFDFGTYGGLQTIVLPAVLNDIVFIQLRVELTNTLSSVTTPELESVNLT